MSFESIRGSVSQRFSLSTVIFKRIVNIFELRRIDHEVIKYYKN